MAAVKHNFTAQQITDEGRTSYNNINIIRTWLNDQDLPILTDEQIVLFLLSCNNNHEATKNAIKAYYSLRQQSPELFDNRKLQRDDYQQYLKVGELCVLPEKTDDGCVIILNRLYDGDHRNYQIDPHFTLLSMTVDAALNEYPPEGLILLLDMQKISLMHLTKVRLGLLKTCFQYLQEGLPVKLKNIHMLNCVYFLDKLMAMVKPISKREVLEKMYFHPPSMDMESFYETWIPKRCLPEDYGGDLPSVRVLHENNIQRLENMQDYFDVEELQRRSVHN